MRKSFLFLFFVIVSVFVFGQQDPQFSQNMFNHIAVNPGYTGSSEKINFSAINRQNWVGFHENSLMTTVFNINSPLSLSFLNNTEKEKSERVFSGGGVGFSVVQDQFTDLNNFIEFKGSFSAKFKVGEGKLAFGLEAGVLNNTPTSINWITPDSPAGSDPSIPSTFDSEISFDLGAGVFYYTDKLYFGLSATHLMRPIIVNAADPSRMNIHYYLASGYEIQMGQSAFDLMPSVFIQTDLQTTQVNVNANLRYNKRFWAGVSYKIDDAIAFMAGLEVIEGLIIGYSYDLITSGIRSYSSGSHEFLLSYSFSLKKEKTPQKYKSVRFL